MRNAHLQTERFVIKGHWWLPRSRRRVAGDLSYTEKDMSLSLYGGLADARVDSGFMATPKRSEYPIVYGESEQGHAITVIKPFYTWWRSKLNWPIRKSTKGVGLRASKLHCRWALYGIHVDSDQSLFSKTTIDVPHFEDWLGDQPFEIDTSVPLPNIRISYKIPANEDFEIPHANCRLRFVRLVTHPDLPLGQSPTIRHDSQIEIEPSTPQPLEWHVKTMAAILDFLSIVYGKPIQSDRFMVHTGAENPISVFYPRQRIKPVDFGPREMLVRYDTIRTSFGDIIRRWLAATPNLTRVRRILVSSELRPAKFIELRFLPLAQAVEVLSNETPHTTIVSSQQFKAVRRKMLKSLENSATPELIKSISDSLGWANGRNLSGKLTGLLNEMSEETRRLFCVDTSRFIRGIVKTRNHFTHYSARSGEKILQGDELYWAIQKLTLLIRVVLLIRSGIPEESVKEQIRSNHRLREEWKVWQRISEEGSPI